MAYEHGICGQGHFGIKSMTNANYVEKLQSFSLDLIENGIYYRNYKSRSMPNFVMKNNIDTIVLAYRR